MKSLACSYKNIKLNIFLQKYVVNSNGRGHRTPDLLNHHRRNYLLNHHRSSYENKKFIIRCNLTPCVSKLHPDPRKHNVKTSLQCLLRLSSPWYYITRHKLHISTVGNGLCHKSLLNKTHKLINIRSC